MAVYHVDMYIVLLLSYCNLWGCVRALSGYHSCDVVALLNWSTQYTNS